MANLAAGALRQMPGSFSLARMLGPGYSLRCALFHDISDTESPFTKGLGVTITPQDFEAAMLFLTKHYTPISLEDLLEESNGRALPSRPVLITFDDAYASVFKTALPLCTKLGVSPVLFANASTLDNQCLMLDNLVCYVANVLGMDIINSGICSVSNRGSVEMDSLADVFTRFLPAVSLPTRTAFREAVVRLAGICERDLATQADLYLTSEQIRRLAVLRFEIGNHTYTHVNCRCLNAADFATEIDRNKSLLEEITAAQVRSFSVPYGSSADLTPRLLKHLKGSGYKAGFLVESLSNGPQTDKLRLYRVSIKARGETELFSQTEILPRLRVIRNRLSSATSLDTPEVFGAVQ